MAGGPSPMTGRPSYNGWRAESDDRQAELQWLAGRAHDVCASVWVHTVIAAMLLGNDWCC